MVKRFGLGKNEKLKSRSRIDDLFASGKRFSVFPLIVNYKFYMGETSTIKIGVTVSKKIFKKAVDRNRIKRQMREAYRMQKTDFLEITQTKKMSCDIFFIYTDKTAAPFNIIKEAMKTCLHRLQQKMPS